MTTAPGRTGPGWDGSVLPVLGVATPGGAVLSVPPAIVPAATVLAADGGLNALRQGLGKLLGNPSAEMHEAVFRWCDTPVEDPGAGVWLPVEDPRVPAWLKAYGPEVLVALVEGAYASGIGIARHNAYGHELAVRTEPRFQGRGFALQLSARAVRRVQAAGALPIAIHHPTNQGSIRISDRLGFADRGWRVLAMIGSFPGGH